ncbi:hypothetical protein Egran_05402 [Elaphomyces granulatus]|uniref:DUF7703 domain-containing protein n=1 Tax=Elaphomyces granulatus TaxID=519963 RepID=A0A232LRP2_9EURO|nr:hypothetical protein Egran_05402 [Elaphomyces granulatus]
MATDATSSTSNEGVAGAYIGNSLGLKITMATFTGLALYNALELVVLVLVTFRQYRGLYFWSLIVSASVGVVPYALGFLLKFFELTSVLWLSLSLITVGWYAMVTGQSIVLYSRLHLVLQSPKVLQRVLCMIIINAIFLHIPTTVLTFGSNLDSGGNGFIRGYNVMEKIQMTGFCLQEFILSGIYIYETVKMLRLNPEPGYRKIMYQLLSLNLLIILMDVGLLTVEYLDYYIFETTLKGTVYSVKLKLEFAVLGQLLNVVRHHGWKPTSSINASEFPDFVDVGAARITSDLTRAPPATRQSRSQQPWLDSDDLSIAVFEHSEYQQDRFVPLARPPPSNGTIYQNDTCD